MCNFVVFQQNQILLGS